MLHGAVGAKVRLNHIESALAKKYEVHTLNFSGHGGEPFPDEPFSIELFANDVLRYLNRSDIPSIHVIGYSMGGYTAIYLASRYPDRFKSLFIIGTKFNWTKETVKVQTGLLDADKISEKLPDYAKELEEIHAPNDWREVLKRTRDMMTQMGKKNPLKDDDLKNLEIPVLIAMGDRDSSVIIEESVFAYRLLKKGQLLILPNTPHPVSRLEGKIVLEQFMRFHSTF